MIETKVEGTPSVVDSAADFLKSSLKSAFDKAADLMPDARREAESSWDGAASEAYRGMLSKILKATDTESRLATQAGQSVQEYAGKLQGIQQRMASRRSDAEAGGLTVNGTVIEEPSAAVSPGDLPAGASREAADEWHKADASFTAQKKKITLYNSLETEVSEDRQSFTNWIETNLKGEPAKLESASQAKQLDDAVKDSPGVALELTQEYSKALPTEMLKDYFLDTAEAKELEARGLKTLAKAQALRSGNPAVRAAAKDLDANAADAAKSSKVAATLDAAGAAEDSSKFAGKLAGAMPGVDVVLGGVTAGLQIAQGGSPGKAIFTNGAGVAAGIGATVAIGLLAPEAPVLLAAGGIALAGYGATKGAEYLWDNVIPKGVEHQIDSGLKDFGSGVADGAKDLAGGAVSGVKSILGAL